jgi:hypothetical protein
MMELNYPFDTKDYSDFAVECFAKDRRFEFRVQHLIGPLEHGGVYRLPEGVFDRMLFLCDRRGYQLPLAISRYTGNTLRIYLLAELHSLPQSPQLQSDLRNPQYIRSDDAGSITRSPGDRVGLSAEYGRSARWPVPELARRFRPYAPGML